jgi:hypothetical protein
MSIAAQQVLEERLKAALLGHLSDRLKEAGVSTKDETDWLRSYVTLIESDVPFMTMLTAAGKLNLQVDVDFPRQTIHVRCPPIIPKRYYVTLAGMAAMKQSQTVEADSAEEAEEIAKENTGDHLWKYIEMDDDTVEAISTEET